MRVTPSFSSIPVSRDIPEASTNQPATKMLWMDADNVVWEEVRLSPNDASLPSLVQSHPDEVLLAPKRVFIGFGVGRLGWAIIWGAG